MTTAAKRLFNFSPGPAILPRRVFEECSRAVLDYAGTGLSILEMSHRSAPIVEMVDETLALVRELLAVPDEFQIVFLQGGASLQFLMAPYNLLPLGGVAAYVETGSWAKKAIAEAGKLGKVAVAGSSADRNFCYLPDALDIPSGAAYLHVTANNTIFGTQYKAFPDAPVPLVADMSSDIFSRPVDWRRFGLVYAGAQKNMGCAGAAVVIVRGDLLGATGRDIPSMLDYRVHIKGASMFNTPPVFALYTINRTLHWLKDLGGVGAVAAINARKAARLYRAIDDSALFRGTADSQARSEMNVTFVLEKPGLEKDFLAFAGERGLDGLKGHRSVGGFRASIYNAMPEAGVEALVECMREFESGPAG